MSIPVEVLTAASAAVAGTMGTDVYQYARARLKEMIAPRNTATGQEPAELVRLDTLAQAVAALQPEQRPIMAEGVRVPVEEILADCADTLPASSLEEFVRSVNEKLAESSPGASQQIVAQNIVGGSIYTAGNDNNIGVTR